MRLNKFLAERLGVSRREADILISNQHVLVDGKNAQIGQQITDQHEVLVDGKHINHKHTNTYLIFNKPRGFVSSRRRQGDTPTLYELLPKKYQTLKTVGRLDKESSGLILLTDDGDFAFQMTHPKFFKIKTYIVDLDRPLLPLHQQMISDIGITLDDGLSKLFIMKIPDKDGKVSGKRLQVEMSEGRNRQIRRTFAALGYEVIGLERIEFGKYKLGDLKPKEFKEIIVDKTLK